MIVRAMRSPYCLRSALVELKILASFLVRKTISTVESHLIYLIGNDLSVLEWGRKRHLSGRGEGEGVEDAGMLDLSRLDHDNQEGFVVWFTAAGQQCVHTKAGEGIPYQ